LSAQTGRTTRAEELPDLKSAMKREIAIKKMKRGMKMKLIGEKVEQGDR
jgi:predicted GIY-YIG superfamily endonuclease